MRHKSAGMRIRVEPGLRADFNHACQMSGVTAAESIRQFMREVSAEFKRPIPTVEDRLRALDEKIK